MKPTNPTPLKKKKKRKKKKRKEKKKKKISNQNKRQKLNKIGTDKTQKCEMTVKMSERLLPQSSL